MTALSELGPEHEPGVIVAWLKTLAGQLDRLDEKTDHRFDQLDDKVDELAEETGDRLTDLETDRRIGSALSERRVRRSDRRRHWIVTSVGLLATLGGAGLGVLLQHFVG